MNKIIIFLILSYPIIIIVYKHLTHKFFKLECIDFYIPYERGNLNYENDIFLIAAPSGAILINPNEGEDKYYPGALVIRNLFLINCINYYPVDDYTELLKEDLSYACLPNFDLVINILNREKI